MEIITITIIIVITTTTTIIIGSRALRGPWPSSEASAN
jgi:hypothetical protein